MKVRPAVHADLAVLVEYNRALAFESEGLELDRERVRKGVEAALTDPAKGTYWVAEQGDAIIGQLLVTREWSDWRNGWFWWIQSVYVSKEHRRQGVFKKLYETLREQIASLPEVCGLRLYVHHDNQTALRTYEELGMEQTHYRLFELEKATKG